MTYYKPETYTPALIYPKKEQQIHARDPRNTERYACRAEPPSVKPLRTTENFGYASIEKAGRG
jgi:hypothetical protein